MKNISKGLVIAATIAVFSITSILSCNKKTSIKDIEKNGNVKPSSLKPKINIGIKFSWKGWGHIVTYHDLNGNSIGSGCPGGGLCDFKVSKVTSSDDIHVTQLQEDANGYFIYALIDETFPMNELNNFTISENITHADEEGLNYTINAGIYPFNANINGYKLPVIIQ
jgi:hypothetical protein